MQIRTEYQQFEPFYKSKHNNNIVWLIRKIVAYRNLLGKKGYVVVVVNKKNSVDYQFFKGRGSRIETA